MADGSTLTAFQADLRAILADLAAEEAGLVADLAASGWDTPTPSPGWTVRLRVTQRLHRDDLDLVATGPVADRWLDLAQAFAGPPGGGREPTPAGGDATGETAPSPDPAGEKAEKAEKAETAESGESGERAETATSGNPAAGGGS